MDAGVVDINNKEDLSRFLDLLDEKSRAIFWYLWWHQHADISELRETIDASSDYDVLHRLKEVINVKAQQIWQLPIVSFEQSKIDPISGENILFSWWLLFDGNAPLQDGSKPVIDIFNEGDYITIVAEVTSPIDLSHADIQFKNGILKVKLKKKENKNIKSVKSKVAKKKVIGESAVETTPQ